MALVGALAVLATLASAWLAAGIDNPAKLTVKCDTTGKQQQTTVTVANTTLQVTCPNAKYQIEPAAGKTPETQEVCVNEQCTEKKALTSFCPSATGKASPPDGNSGLALTIPSLPPQPASFYLQCKAPGGTADRDCVVKVSVKNAVAGGQIQAGKRAADGKAGSDESEASKNPQSGTDPAGAAGPAGSHGTAGSQDPSTGNKGQDHVNTAGPGNEGGGESTEQDQVPGGVAGPGESAGVQTCENPKTSITVHISEQGSVAKFACKSGFDLYPSQADKIFSKDCKKQETLKDMTRTQASVPAPPAAPEKPGPPGAKDATPTRTSAPASEANTGTPAPPAASPSVVYTLKANKKPPKKHLCYLCAKERVSAAEPGTAENYCTIYVESGARKQLELEFRFASMLLCVLAMLCFT